MDLVGAEGFGRSTSWSRTMKPRRINNLEIGTVVTSDSQLLLVSNDLRHLETGTLAISSNGSMWGGGHSIGHNTVYPAHEQCA